MCSSTRAEIAAVIGALTDEGAVHIGIDNKGAMIHTVNLIRIAAQWESYFQHQPGWVPPKYPLGKAWGILPDGDLLKTVWQGIQKRGIRSQALTKVKGHATPEDVINGISTTEHRLGNNEADTCATRGIHEAAKDTHRRIVVWLLRRQGLYALWLRDINRLIVAVMKAEKRAERNLS